MKLSYTTRFQRSYGKLSRLQKSQVDKAIRLFCNNPFAPQLRNHPLKGQLSGIRSIKAGYDLRILYTEENGHTVIIFIAVGGHDQVY